MLQVQTLSRAGKVSIFQGWGSRHEGCGKKEDVREQCWDNSPCESCSPWHAYVSCSVPEALDFVAFSNPKQSRKIRVFQVNFHLVCGAKVRRKKCWGWHAFSSCSVRGLQGSLVFSTLTLSITLTLREAAKADSCLGAQDINSAKKKAVERAIFGKWGFPFLKYNLQNLPKWYPLKPKGIKSKE